MLPLSVVPLLLYVVWSLASPVDNQQDPVYDRYIKSVNLIRGGIGNSVNRNSGRTSIQVINSKGQKSSPSTSSSKQNDEYECPKKKGKKCSEEEIRKKLDELDEATDESQTPEEEIAAGEREAEEATREEENRQKQRQQTTTNRPEKTTKGKTKINNKSASGFNGKLKNSQVEEDNEQNRSSVRTSRTDPHDPRVFEKLDHTIDGGSANSVNENSGDTSIRIKTRTKRRR